jgi:hypothetical protein
MSPLPPKQAVPDEIQQRLKALGIYQMVNAAFYGVFFRDGCMVIAQREPNSGMYYSIGSAGYNVDGVGVSFLVWDGDTPYLVRKDCDRVPATKEHLAILSKFSADIKAALGLEEASTAPA